MKRLFSSVTDRTKSSIIRELLKLINRQGVISFAGGLPAPDTFPVALIQSIIADLLKTNAVTALQYGPTSGLEEFRHELCLMLRAREGLDISADNIIVTASSQQGLDLISRSFIDKGDRIVMELPSYIGAIQVFHSYGADMIGIKSDGEGIDTGHLEKVLARYGKRTKLMYVVPDFQNPSGLTMSVERRSRLVALAEKYGMLIVEDSPYRQLRFEGTAPEMIHRIAGSDNVISLFTFSKTLAPGFRLGYIVASKKITGAMTIIKQSMDLCTSPFNQLIAMEFIRRGYYDAHIDLIINKYRNKRDVMLESLEKFMPRTEGLYWTRPEGGLFLWVVLPEYIDADRMFYQAIEKNVAYVIGSAFHCNNKGRNTFRMNFSYSSEDEIQEGIKRLAQVVRSNIR
ncbi:MAG: PLP-dependent aminotransferase family protein [Oligoflexia bacterium]|nr:PLP-dependent aminotransferase family protein [Oligoflexia bacterium]